MYRKISKTEEIISKLKLEGKVKSFSTEEDLKQMEEINKYMEEVRRDYINKSVMSWRSASKTILY